MQINTVKEQDAYDKGFADAKDYWVPMEQERIIALLEANIGHGDPEGDTYFMDAIDLIKDGK